MNFRYACLVFRIACVTRNLGQTWQVDRPWYISTRIHSETADKYHGRSCVGAQRWAGRSVR